MKEEYFKEGLDNRALHAIQEMAELTKCLTKCMMYGWGNHSPFKHPVTGMNYKEVLRELDDVRVSSGRLLEQMQTDGDDKLIGDMR